MRPITLTGFNGSNQAIDPVELPESVGVFMENAYPGLGDLRPLDGHLTVASVPTSPQRRSIRRMGRSAINDALYWLGWSTFVTATLGFGSEPNERTYFTGSGSPKWTDTSIALAGGPPYPQATRELAVPAPSTAPVATLNTDGMPIERVRYVMDKKNPSIEYPYWDRIKGRKPVKYFVENGLLVVHDGSQKQEQKTEEQDENSLVALTQIMGSYFDTIAVQIDTIPKIKQNGYMSSSAKPYPFYDRLLESEGFKVPELFARSFAG